jgi:hypothetical protein
LLQGAVVAILELERNHPEINMSTHINDSAGLGRYVAWFAYGWMAVALIGFSLWSWLASEKQDPPRTTLGARSGGGAL